MPGGSTKTQNVSQQSQTDPWDETLGLLRPIIGRYSGMDPSVTGAQSGALANLSSAASSIPNFGATAAGGVNKLFGSDTMPQVGMLGQGYDTLRANLGATASGANLDPYSTPGFGDAINTMSSDITNRVKGVYNAAGRDPSGAGSFAKSLGRGLTEGISPVIASQYNTNVGNMMNANKSLFDASNTTATGQAALGQIPLSNILSGINAAGMLPGLYTGPATAQLGAANASYGQGFQNLAQLLQPSATLAALGSQSSGNSTGETTQKQSTLSNILGAGMGVTGMLGQTGAFGSSGWLSPAFSALGSGASSLASSAASFLPSLLAFSDERLKDDIEPVGMLHDGQPLYSYRYKGDSEPRIGLLAQEVEKRDPGAVVEIAGYKAVDYGRATRKARAIGAGMLDRMAA